LGEGLLLIINKVRFADDTAIIPKRQEELQGMVSRVVNIGGSIAWKSTLTNFK
jgi:hypothetical protein